MPTDVKISKNPSNIQVSVNRPSQQDNRNIQVDINKDVPKPKINIELNLRKSLDGNLMILDHRDLDIVVMPAKSKVMAFAKETVGDHVYDSQDRFFKYLVNKGVVERESVQGGNIYYSMEAKIPTSKQHNMIENIVPFAILIFLLHAMEISNSQTMLGASLFFYGSLLVDSLRFSHRFPQVFNG